MPPSVVHIGHAAPALDHVTIPIRVIGILGVFGVVDRADILEQDRAALADAWTLKQSAHLELVFGKSDGAAPDVAHYHEDLLPARHGAVVRWGILKFRAQDGVQLIVRDIKLEGRHAARIAQLTEEDYLLIRIRRHLDNAGARIFVDEPPNVA